MPVAVPTAVQTATGLRRLTPKLHQFDAIIDILLSEPTISLKEVGARLGRSSAWVSYMVHSGTFRDLYEERRREKNAEINQDLTQRLAAVATKSLQKLEEVLEKNPEKINPMQALEIADKSLERMGYGVKLPGTIVPDNVLTAPPMTLSAEDFAHVQSVVRSVEVSRTRVELSMSPPQAYKPENKAPLVEVLPPRVAGPRADPALATSPRLKPTESLNQLLDAMGLEPDETEPEV